MPQVATEIEQRLGRKLEPHDLWYEASARGDDRPRRELDALTRKRYPTAEAFAKDMPRILRDLGFTDGAGEVPRRAHRGRSVARRGPRDAGARGAATCRTCARASRPGGMDYKGYNIAVHELGHNVEQVFSLYDVDHTLLAGVPNTAFTEALAFVFQARDLELLGRPKPDARGRARCACSTTSGTRGRSPASALVDIDVWHWMYEHPDATPARAARGDGADRARASGTATTRRCSAARTRALLGIYSHMIAYPLYLFDYLARPPDRVPDRGAPRGQGQGDVRDGVRAHGPHRRDPARPVDAARDRHAGQREPLLDATARALKR